MSARSRGQQREPQMKFTSAPSTSVWKTCRPLSGLRTTQRELCSAGVTSTALRASTSEQISVTKPSSSFFNTEEVHIGKRVRRTGFMTRQSFLWSWTRSAAADWERVWRNSTFLKTTLWLHPKWRRRWTRWAYHTFLWSMSGHPYFHRKWRISLSKDCWLSEIKILSFEIKVCLIQNKLFLIIKLVFIF